MSRWDELSMSGKSDLIKLYIKNGIYNLEDIKKDYNSYGDGGSTKKEESNILNNVMLKLAGTLFSSNIISKENKSRLVELGMRLSGGNPDDDNINKIVEYLKTKDGINTLKEVLFSKDSVDSIIAKSNNPPDNYGGLAYSNDFVDMDSESFYEQYPGDIDFVSSYITGRTPFEGAGVVKIDDKDSTRFGRYKKYIDDNYKDRYIPTYQGYKDTLDVNLVRDLNLKSYNKETSTYGVNTDTDLGFEFGKFGETEDGDYITPGYYDAAGYNLELIKGKDGKIYGRKSDMYDFLPKDFNKDWVKNENLKPIINTVDSLGNPFIFRSPWFDTSGTHIPQGILDDFNNKHNIGGPLKKDNYNIFEDENSFASRDAHRASLTEFVEANPKLYGINTSDFVDFFSELSGLEGSYNHEAGKGMPYSGYYGLKGGRDYSREDQHKRAFKHLSELFKNNIVKEDLKKGAERGYTQAQILAKYWNQGNRVTNYLYNNVDDNDGVGTKISDYGWNMKSNIDYSNYLKDAITDDFVLVKNVNTLSDAIKRSRNKGTNFSNREKYILDLNTEVKKHLKKDKEAKFDPLKLRVGDTIWLNRPKYLNK